MWKSQRNRLNLKMQLFELNTNEQTDVRLDHVKKF